MFSERELLIILLVKIAVITSMASLLLRWSFAKKLLLREQRTIRQRLHLGVLFGLFFAGGSLVRHSPGYKAAELSLEGAFVTGLVGGYVPGALAGALVSLPAVLMSPHEWLTFPLMIGVGALGGLLRDVAPGTEEIWRFTPFHPFTVAAWRLRVLRTPQGGFQMLMFVACLGIEFIRSNLGHAFADRQWLFVIYPEESLLNPATVVLVYFSTVLSVGLTLKIWNNTRNEWKLEEQRRLLVEARLASLTSQINPHFLFNTLNSVASLIRSDRQAARQLIFKLSTILRRLLRKQESLSALRDEVAFIDDYLSIEVVRFGDKLRVVKEIDTNTLDALVPSMMLQPIVENSIKHGISPKVGGGTIWLRSAVQGSRLQIEVEDDGVGIPPDALPGVFSRGIGISNVNERLRVIFGHEGDMVIEHRPGGGTRVRMQIPELRDPAAAAERAQAAAPAAAPAGGPAPTLALRQD